MSGSIGTGKNQTCMQTDLLLEDGYRTDDCRSTPEPAGSTGTRP
jgi:hypothetical protein